MYLVYHVHGWLLCHLHVNLLSLSFLLFHHLLQRQEPVLPQLDPFVRVADTGILNQGSKHHEEADKEVDVNGLHVGDLGQGGIDRVDQGGHGQNSGDPQTNLQVRNSHNAYHLRPI